MTPTQTPFKNVASTFTSVTGTERRLTVVDIQPFMKGIDACGIAFPSSRLVSLVVPPSRRFRGGGEMSVAIYTTFHMVVSVDYTLEALLRFGGEMTTTLTTSVGMLISDKCTRLTVLRIEDIFHDFICTPCATARGYSHRIFFASDWSLFLMRVVVVQEMYGVSFPRIQLSAL